MYVNQVIIMNKSKVYKKLRKIPLLTHSIWKNNPDGFVAEVDETEVEVVNPEYDLKEIEKSLREEFPDSDITVNSEEEKFEVMF